MKLLLLILLSGACHAQTGELGELPTTPPRYDTIPADLIYRTKYGQTGWVRGWEVRRIDTIAKYDYYISDGKTSHGAGIPWYEAERTHIKYLQSDRRPFPKGTRVAKVEGVKTY